MAALEDPMGTSVLLKQNGAAKEPQSSLCWVPNAPFIAELFNHVESGPDATLFIDETRDLAVTRRRMLLDILSVRDKILESLNEDIQADLLKGNVDVFICILLPSSYEFFLVFLALIALGAAAVPLLTSVLPEEADYLIKVSGARAIITNTAHSESASAIRDVTNLQLVALQENLPQKQDLGRTFLQLHSQDAQNPEKAALVLFTSGTTRAPKGVLHTRGSIYNGAKQGREAWDLSSDDLFLQYSLVHWSGGISFMLAVLLAGGRIEHCKSVFSPDWFWERMEKGDVTYFSSYPPTYLALARYFTEHVGTGSPLGKKRKVEGLRRVRLMSTGSDAASSSSLEFWQTLRGGRPLVSNYGTTETTVWTTTTDWKSMQPLAPRCVGHLMNGVKSNLADGEEGELRLKSPAMFKRYLSLNPGVMDGVFDDEGYFLTGDIVKRKGSNYFILGRDSQDVIRSSSWKFYTPEIEDHILSLADIQESLVLGIEDENCGERVAAIIRSRRTQNAEDTALPSLSWLRDNLTAHTPLPKYKLPTLLKVLQPGEEIPRTSNGKPSKRLARTRFFPLGLVEKGEVEVLDLNEVSNATQRAWDWDGLGVE